MCSEAVRLLKRQERTLSYPRYGSFLFIEKQTKNNHRYTNDIARIIIYPPISTQKLIEKTQEITKNLIN